MIKQMTFLFILLAAMAGHIYQSDSGHAVQAATRRDGTPVYGSGSIEADSIDIAAETGGRIVAVYVDEGDEVFADELLIKLDASMLLAQQVELQAAIDTTQANLAAVRDGPQDEDIALAQAELAQAQAGREAAYTVWQESLRLVEHSQPLMVPIRQLQSEIRQAEGMIELAQASAKEAAIKEEAASRDQSNYAGLVTQEVTQKQHQAALTGITIAEKRRDALQTQLNHLWAQYNNPLKFKVQANQAEAAYHIAQAAEGVAKAKLAAVEAGPTEEAIAVAEAQVRQATSMLALLEVQLDQLALTAPQGGLISTRVVDPGELATPGAPLLKLTNLDRVTLRVFIPETQIGQVKLGQEAMVRIDSVSTPFQGRVTYIANEAEFTPKNVQTKEERVNLVFAVEIGLDNPDHILKPGMPADAEILPWSTDQR